MKDRSFIRGMAITLATFLALLILLLLGLTQIDHRSASEQAASLKTAVLRAAMTCYAVEGRYPPDAAYLTQYYGLTYNTDRYIVSIHSFADNLLPDIMVLAEGGGTV